MLNLIQVGDYGTDDDSDEETVVTVQSSDDIALGMPDEKCKSCTNIPSLDAARTNCEENVTQSTGGLSLDTLRLDISDVPGVIASRSAINADDLR